MVNDTPIGHDQRPWPPHPRRRKHPCNSGCPPAPGNAGRNWPASTSEFRGEFAYVTGRLPDGDTLPLMRLRYGGSAARWGFAIYLASKDGYEDSVLPTGVLRRRTRRRPGHRLRPLPRRPHRLDLNPRRTYERDHLARVSELPLDQLRAPNTSGGSFDDRSRWIQAELVPITLT